ncbi:uncharacterized protein [Palaemon carinicauda]|uniref:uncharacterized protein n=1 Tax=Palaemon carinicauda TaxID=392227 RepID=UPI0035B691E5
MGKIKVMRCTRRKGGAKLNVMPNGELLEVVDQFKYLGSVVAANKVEADVYESTLEKRLRECVAPKFGEWKIRPIIIYGNESWTLTPKTRSQLQEAEMKVMRLIKGITRLDKLRSKGIRRDLGVEGIWEKTNTVVWTRQENGRRTISKEILGMETLDIRPVSRPKIRWMENIERGVRRGLNLQEIEEEKLYDCQQ